MRERERGREGERRMEMAATSEEGLESLILNFDQFSQGYRDAVSEIRSLKLNYSHEMTRREAFEASCNALRTDNERLRKLYAESLTRLTSQIKHHKKCQSLKEELEKTSERLLTVKIEYRKTIEMLEQENERKINDLEKQISCYCLQRASDESVIKKLQQELSAHETQIYNLTRNLEEVTANVDFKYNRDMQELKDWIIVEQEEKKKLYKKLQDAENELQTMRNKQAEQQRESISIRQVETLKQKIMRLRKENESLKRQKQGSES